MPVIDIQLTEEQFKAATHALAVRNGRKGGLKARNQKQAIAARWRKYRREKKVKNKS